MKVVKVQSTWVGDVYMQVLTPFHINTIIVYVLPTMTSSCLLNHILKVGHHLHSHMCGFIVASRFSVFIEDCKVIYQLHIINII